MSVVSINRHIADKNFLKNLLDSSLEGVIGWVPVKDWIGSVTDFRYLFLNQTAERLLETPREQLIGKCLSEALTNENEVQPRIQRYLEVWNTGETITGEVPCKIDSVQHWFRVRISKIDGGLVTYFQDITLNKQAEAEQSKFEKLKESLLESPDAIMWVKDLKGSYTFVNRAMRDLLGLRHWEILGKDDRALFNSEVAQHFQDSDKRVMLTGRPERAYQRISVAGKSLKIFTYKFPIFDREGGLCGVGGISTESELDIVVNADTI